MQPVNVQQAEVYLRRVGFWPVCCMLFAVLLLNVWQDMRVLQQEQAYRAQRIADFLAVSAAQEGSTGQDFSIFQEQVERVLRIPDVQSIRFVRTRPNVADQAVSLLNAPSAHLQRYAPVEFLVFAAGDARYVLGGYVEVDLAIRGGFVQYQQQLKQQLLVLVLLLGLFWLLLWSWARRAVLPLHRVTQMAEQLRQGQPMMARQPDQPIRIAELEQLEAEFVEIAAQLQADRCARDELTLQVEQLRQREQIAQSSRDHFQSMITHELKSPLNAI